MNITQEQFDTMQDQYEKRKTYKEAFDRMAKIKRFEDVLLICDTNDRKNKKVKITSSLDVDKIIIRHLWEGFEKAKQEIYSLALVEQKSI